MCRLLRQCMRQLIKRPPFVVSPLFGTVPGTASAMDNWRSVHSNQRIFKNCTLFFVTGTIPVFKTTKDQD
jgi:hypothetical protein